MCLRRHALIILFGRLLDHNSALYFICKNIAFWKSFIYLFTLVEFENFLKAHIFCLFLLAFVPPASGRLISTASSYILLSLQCGLQYFSGTIPGLVHWVTLGSGRSTKCGNMDRTRVSCIQCKNINSCATYITHLHIFKFALWIAYICLYIIYVFSFEKQIIIFILEYGMLIFIYSSNFLSSLGSYFHLVS